LTHMQVPWRQTDEARVQTELTKLEAKVDAYGKILVKQKCLQQ